ncbi:sodium:solute symporter family protein [Undibacterium rugosum]|uniref:Cation acetate symporter n=1 Tax=Undibacterium rugosum TaxID=2762291 RepID=A0A923I9H3_9BURK|nr:sodium:solute symporter family protein [Undibacterium rugosum]MBC3936028.1 cation acetate symporter [Undibacterium rugosum]MBR7778639.1 cation acetate symporter [Undibacterium rugosum]
MAPGKFTQKLTLYYLWYTFLFLVFLISLAILEKEGVPRAWIGYLFMFATIVIYAGIGLVSRTSDITEYYVAGRRVPAVFNGMATAADWLSAASFLSLAGGLFLQGFDGLAYIIGWTGGFCLVAMLIAPYIRKFGQYTIADFLGTRFAGPQNNNLVRILAVSATVFISFIYVVAQIYGVGLITSRFTGVDFSVGIFLGLASILVCSFLGGMRAITWTQVAQYIIIIVAFMIPVSWLSLKHADNPVPQISYGEFLKKLVHKEQEFAHSDKEQQVRTIYRQRADVLQRQIERLPASWLAGRDELQRRLDELKSGNGSLIEIKNASKNLARYPKSENEARQQWLDARNALISKSQTAYAQYTPYAAKDQKESDSKRNNFMALVLCLMMGTAALPHVLTRYYTTPSVTEARDSVFWSLFFIMLLYITIPALAILVKYDIYTSLVGSEFSKLPSWVTYWASIDKLNPLVSINDVNQDGIVQLAEIMMDGDIIVLATPEIAGLPYVVSALVAAGGLAAALSTADGLLLTISNSLSHDIYYKIVDPSASTQKRVTMSKLILLVVALIAAYVASLKPADILSLVGAAFSVAASTLFPALVLGIFWKRANYQGAVAGMIAGFSLCIFYMMYTHPLFGGNPALQWGNIASISAGIFGVPFGILTMIIVSLLTPAPDRQTTDLVDHIRCP